MRRFLYLLAALAVVLLCIAPFLLFRACRSDEVPEETVAGTPDPTLAPDITVEGGSGWSEEVPEEAEPVYGLDPEMDLLPYPESDGVDAYAQQLALLQRPDGSIGTVSIARTGLNAPIYEGTDTQAMIDGAGHWTGSSLGGGNVCLFGHNRGANPWFGELLDTEIGDTVVLETSAGTRTYRVSQVEQISSEDFTWLGSTGSSCITLISCVEGRPELRLMVRGEEVLPAETETVLQTTHD